MATFGLVHGGGHGGWCWELLVPELAARGHAAVAPDLPAEDPAAGALECASVVVDALGDAEDVVLVGHSLGGMTIPVVASLRHVRRLVFLGAMVPAPGEVFGDYLASQQPGAVPAHGLPTPVDERGVRGKRSWEDARRDYYHDVDEATARAAWARMRGNTRRLFVEPCPLERWPDVPSTYILMTEDRAVSQDFSRKLARERLGVEPIELPGSHSPFMSRPAELADVLVSLL